MGLAESAPFAQKGSLRSLTETTWNSSRHSQQYSNRIDLHPEKERIAEPDSAMLPQIRQGGRDLEDYLSSVEEMRAQLSLRKREGEIVAAFVRGLYDAGTRGRVEGEMDRAGWSWDTLGKIVGKEIELEMVRDAECVCRAFLYTAAGPMYSFPLIHDITSHCTHICPPDLSPPPRFYPPRSPSRPPRWTPSSRHRP